MGKRIVKCRVCQSNRLKYALKLDDIPYVVCQICTLLQMQEDVEFNITFDLSSGVIAVDYYPFYLSRMRFPSPQVMYFSLKAIEALLELKGYKVVNAQTTDQGKLEVMFEELNSMDRIRLYEMMKKLNSQYTFFLYEVKKK